MNLSPKWGVDKRWPPLLAPPFGPPFGPLISTNKNRMNTCLLETKESNVFHSSLGILVTNQQFQNCIAKCRRGCLGIPVMKRYFKYRIV